MTFDEWASDQLVWPTTPKEAYEAGASSRNIENEQLRNQNRQLKEALIGWRQRAFQGTDQRSVIERDYPDVFVSPTALELKAPGLI